jgi:hypothetical protein
LVTGKKGKRLSCSCTCVLGAARLKSREDPCPPTNTLWLDLFELPSSRLVLHFSRVFLSLNVRVPIEPEGRLRTGRKRLTAASRVNDPRMNGLTPRIPKPSGRFVFRSPHDGFSRVQESSRSDGAHHKSSVPSCRGSSETTRRS